jgi:hypothetical protein
MLLAESRVKELEQALRDYLADFEVMSTEFAECAEKLAAAEHNIDELTGAN